jgi:acyl-CoA thioesterase-2
MHHPSEMRGFLALEPHGPDVFVGESPAYPWGPRVYGGLVVAQALWAAATTVDVEYRPHSLHAYFIRGGTHTEPIRYEIDRIRNGRSFVTRSVVARQSGGAIFNLSASFHIDEPQTDVQTVAMPEVTPPDELSSDGWSEVYDHREVPCEGYRYLAWIRTRGTPATSVGAACSLAYVSDDFPMDAIGRSHPVRSLGDEYREQFMGATLDHAMWFHRPLPIDEWMLFDMRARGLSGGRGMAFGEVFSAEGVHLASLAQEGLLRELTR